MKRSLLDPLPRPLSTPALVALVALVVCGTGVAVMRFLETAPGSGDARRGTVFAAPEGAPAPERAPNRDAVRPTRPSSTRTLSAAGSDARGDAWGGGNASGSESRPRVSPCSAASDEPTLARPSEGS